MLDSLQRVPGVCGLLVDERLDLPLLVALLSVSQILWRWRRDCDLVGIGVDYGLGGAIKLAVSSAFGGQPGCQCELVPVISIVNAAIKIGYLD